MRFYEACVAVAQIIEQEMTKENKETFMHAETSELEQYHFSLGLWIRNHCLEEEEYLYQTFQVLGKRSKDDMSMFLLEFTQQYFLLKSADML